MKSPVVKKKDVVFRRVHGRVIPIRVNRSQSQVGKKTAGVAALAAGAVAAERAGDIASKFQLGAAHAERLAKKVQLVNPGRFSKLLKRSASLHKTRNLAILGGAALGGALASAGASLLGHKPGQAETPEGIKTTAGFALAATLAGASYYFRIGQARNLKGVLNAFKLARKRPTIQYTLKGI